MTDPCEAAAVQLTGLLRSHWRAIQAAKEDAKDGVLSVSLGLKLERDGKNHDIAKATIAYGVRVKDDATVQLDHPDQGKLTYELKDTKTDE